MSNTKKTLPVYDGRIAKVTNISLSHNNKEIIVTIQAEGSIYIGHPRRYGPTSLMNSGTVVEGFDLVLKHGHHAVNAIKEDKQLFELAAEVSRLKNLLHDICNFENGGRVTIKEMSYQKAINENSFYEAIKTLV